MKENKLDSELDQLDSKLDRWDLELEQIQFTANSMISKLELDKAYNMDIILETHAKNLVMKVSEMVAAEPLDEYSQEVSFFAPSNWWEHFKDTFFPKWWLRRFPVKQEKKSKTVTYKVKALYPTLPKSRPGMKYYIHVMKDVK